MVRPRAARAAALLLAAAAGLSACRHAGLEPPAAAAAAARRSAGPRLPRGPDPARLGLQQVLPGVWVPAPDAPHWGVGGEGLLPPRGAPSGAGVLLRSAHVQVETDLPAREALPWLRLAQGFVEDLVSAWGEALDLRLPAAPLVVEVHAGRAGLEAALARWGAAAGDVHAWYDRGLARVMLSAEAPGAGAMPWQADLRHELVHAVLDLASPDAPPLAQASRHGWGWLWEGVALRAEDGVPAAGGPALRLRLERARQRARRDGALPLQALVGLPLGAWEGQHYDLCAAWMASLQADPGWRLGEAGLLRALLRGDLAGFDAQRAFGRTLDAEQARFEAWLAMEGAR